MEYVPSGEVINRFLVIAFVLCVAVVITFRVRAFPTNRLGRATKLVKKVGARAFYDNKPLDDQSQCRLEELVETVNRVVRLNNQLGEAEEAVSREAHEEAEAAA